MVPVIESLKPRKPPLDAVWEVYCDGATKGSNPSSEGGYGFSVWCNDKLYYAQHGQLVGARISNQNAEFKAAFFALQYCNKRGIMTPTIWTDSEFVVNAYNGSITLKNETLLLQLAALKHFNNFLTPTFKHTPRTREFQRFTDFLANLGLVNDLSYNTKASHEALIHAYHSWRN